MLQLDGVIVGAGILGMLTGLEIIKASPNLDLAILEKEKFVGEHSSSRNSGVLHAGIYYPKNSLKAQLCVKGNSEIYSYAQKRGIKFNKCGKLIIDHILTSICFLSKCKMWTINSWHSPKL